MTKLPFAEVATLLTGRRDRPEPAVPRPLRTPKGFDAPRVPKDPNPPLER